MKRIIALTLTIVMMFALCGCMKSEEIKNAEAGIATLNSNSTYKEIYDVYCLYSAVPYDKRDKVENASVLAEYCDLGSGHFVLTDTMLSEIKGKFQMSSLGISDAEFSIAYNFGIQKIINSNWDQCKNIKIASDKKDDKYTYTGYGTISIQDNYGSISSHNVRISYFAVYDEEEELGYKISSDVVIAR